MRSLIDEENMRHIGEILMRGLRSMDAEAVSEISGRPAGLYGYTAHVKSTSPKFEDVWSSRLADILNESGYKARTQITFPAQTRKKCDLQVSTRDHGDIWIE